MTTSKTPSLAARLNELPIPAAERARYVRELAHAEACADDVVGLVRDVHAAAAAVAGWFSRRRPGFAR
jgi:hypothetical protein